MPPRLRSEALFSPGLANQQAGIGQFSKPNRYRSDASLNNADIASPLRRRRLSAFLRT
jgi:hypothetical protein